MSDEAQKQAAVALCDALKHTQHTLAATAAAALGYAGIRGALPLPEAPAPPASTPTQDKQATKGDAPDAKRSKTPPQEAPASSSTPTAAGSKDESSCVDDKASGQTAMQRIMALTKDKDVKVIQRAATAAGHICAGHGVKSVLDPALEALFALGFNKNEDVLFTVGEALCFAFGGECAVASTQTASQQYLMVVALVSVMLDWA